MTSVEDRLEIEALCQRYALGMDLGEREHFAAVWSDDAVWVCEAMGLHAEGHDAILAFYDRGPGRAPRVPDAGSSVRLTGNLLVDLDGDTASGLSEFVAHRFDGTSLHPYSAGHYRDTYARTSHGWRITHRTMVVTPMATPNATAP